MDPVPYFKDFSKILKSAALFKIPTLTVYDFTKFIFPNQKSFQNFFKLKYKWVSGRRDKKPETVELRAQLRTNKKSSGINNFVVQLTLSAGKF